MKPDLRAQLFHFLTRPPPTLTPDVGYPAGPRAHVHWVAVPHSLFREPRSKVAVLRGGPFATSAGVGGRNLNLGVGESVLGDGLFEFLRVGLLDFLPGGRAEVRFRALRLDRAEVEQRVLVIIGEVTEQRGSCLL